jgi:serine/threonine protein kinase
MGLRTGEKIGPYEIQSRLGAGGMGEVYRARDTRLHRDVAVKVLSPTFADDADRLRRFEQEARATALLNHPNIVAIFDVGTSDGQPYLVSELLDGQTLRERLSDGVFPIRRVLEYGLQIVHGLAAAHEKGVIHRDLKPENLLITKDGRVKILDFGLAKLTEHTSASHSVATIDGETTLGMVLGTIGYMSPEQVRGLPVDTRTDLFSFGVILYEMLSGKPAFKGTTSADTMSAILTQDPPPLTQTNRSVPQTVERIVGRCLEKDRELRFQATRDLAFAMEDASASTPIDAVVTSAATRRWLSVRTLVAIAAIAFSAALAGYFSGRHARMPEQPLFRQLTHSRGDIDVARFTPEGQTVVFGGEWNGEPMRVFFQRTDSSEFSPLPLPDRTSVLSVSSTGELAVGLRRVAFYYWVSRGVLARVALTGGAPREVLEGVQDADWSPDGSGLAVTRQVGRQYQLEFPIGKILYKTNGYISHIRFSPRGDRIAFMDHPIFLDNRGTVCVLDLAGSIKVLTPDWGGEMGLAWSPRGDELWFAAGGASETYALRAVDLNGHQRVLLRAPLNLFLQDVSRDGRVLLTTDERRQDVFVGTTGNKQEKDLTWFAESWFQQISDDGKFIVFDADDYNIYMRNTDGSPAVLLGRGQNRGPSPDGKWVLAIPAPDNNQFLLIPTGAGESRTFTTPSLHYRNGLWLPDSQHLLMVGLDASGQLGTYLQSITGEDPKLVGPANVAAVAVSPDGRSFLGATPDSKYAIYSLEGGVTHEIPGLTSGDAVIQWLKDNRTLLVGPRLARSVPVYEFDLVTGRRKLWKQFDPGDKVGLTGMYVAVSRDRNHYIYAAGRNFSALYVVDGLK